MAAGRCIVCVCVCVRRVFFFFVFVLSLCFFSFLVSSSFFLSCFVFFEFFSVGFFPSFSRCHMAGSRVLRSSISLLFSICVSWLSETVLAVDFALFLLS